MLLDADTYQAITGDTATPNEAQLRTAQKRVEGYLRGHVEAGTYTDRLRVHSDWAVYPPAANITDAGGQPIDGPAVYITPGFVSFASRWQTPGFSVFEAAPNLDPIYATLTYTAGWTLDSAPQAVLDGLAWETWRAINPAKVPSPGGNEGIAIGATSLTTGDVSVSYPPGGPGGLQVTASGLMAASQALLCGHRWGREVSGI